MRTTSILATVVLSAFAGGAVFACSSNEDEWGANLSPAAEIPTPAGTPTATAKATLELDGNVLHVVVTIDGELTSPVTMAHLHGPAATNGTANIVLDFVPSMAAVISAGTTTGTIVDASFDLDALTPSTTGVLRVDKGTLIDFLNNGQAYVNVHTVNNQNGEIRGQVTRN